MTGLDLDRILDSISKAGEDSLAAIESAVNQARAARTAERNAALPEFPWVISLDVPGHRPGAIAQVTRAAAIVLIESCSHRLATDEEVAAYNGRTA
jgi:hypothetical protein